MLILCINIISILIIIKIVVLYSKLNGEFLNHITTSSVIYCSSLGLNQLWFTLCEKSEYALTSDTLYVIYISWVAYLIGSIMFNNYREKFTDVRLIKRINSKLIIIILNLLKN